MYELNQVGERSYYIQSPAKIGLFRLNDTDVCLVGSTVRSYLAWLKDTGRLNAFFDDGLLLWQRV